MQYVENSTESLPSVKIKKSRMHVNMHVKNDIEKS